MAKEKGKELPVDLKICKSVKVAKNTHSPRKSKLYFPEYNHNIDYNCQKTDFLNEHFIK